MLRFSSTALVLAGALFGVAADSPPLAAGPAGRASLAGSAIHQTDRPASPAGDHLASSLPTDCPCAGECGMAEQARHRDE